MDAKSILHQINLIAEDKEPDSKITVLPYMCGSGKSTAISYLIRQTIENHESTGDGLLIVTDRKDRMEDYLCSSCDAELDSFLKKKQATHNNNDT